MQIALTLDWLRDKCNMVYSARKCDTEEDI